METATYYIEAPTMLFLHPSEIVCWRNISDKPAGIYCMFKKWYLDLYPSLKAIIERYHFFTEKKIIRLTDASYQSVQPLFKQLINQSIVGGNLSEETMQAYLQLILIERLKGAAYSSADKVSLPLSEIYEHITFANR